MGNSDTILVYHHRLGEFRGNPLVNKNPGVVTRGELNYWLKHSMSHRKQTSVNESYADSDTDPEFQATTKRLTTRHPTIYQRDLLTADQVAGFGSKGNYDQDRAEVRIELIDYYLHRYRELTIISHAPSKHGEN
jgi:hypothetical protein